MDSPFSHAPGFFLISANAFWAASGLSCAKKRRLRVATQASNLLLVKEKELNMSHLLNCAREEWRPVVGWEERYEVSSLGRVRSLGYIDPRHAGKFINLRRDNNGYLVVRFYKNSKAFDRTVHSIVAEAFIGPRPDGYVVNHKDGVKTNPLPENLEYVTVAENNLHAFRVLGRSPVRPFGKREVA